MNGEFSKYDSFLAYKLGFLCKIAYSDQNEMKKDLDCFKFDEYKFIEVDDTQLIIARKNGTVYLAFRGTESLEDWKTDLSAAKTDFIINGKCYGKVHIGFLKSFNKVKSKIEKFLLKDSMKGSNKIYVTGHSLGGGIATLAAFYLKVSFLQFLQILIYTYGSPRVGNKVFVKNYVQKLNNYTFRHVNQNDVVCLVPTLFMGYRHVKKEIYFDQDKKRYFGPSLSLRFKNLFIGSMHDIGKIGLDGIKDHFMDKYLIGLLKAQSE